MAIDIEIENAIKAAADELGQPDAVVRVLKAWMRDESDRDLPHADRVEHLSNLRNAIELPET